MQVLRESRRGHRRCQWHRKALCERFHARGRLKVVVADLRRERRHVADAIGWRRLRR